MSRDRYNVATTMSDNKSEWKGPSGSVDDIDLIKGPLYNWLKRDQDGRHAHIHLSDKDTHQSKELYIWMKDGQYALYDSKGDLEHGRKGNAYLSNSAADILDKGISMFTAIVEREDKRRQMEQDYLGEAEAEVERIERLLAEAEHKLGCKRSELSDNKEYKALLKPGDGETLDTLGVRLGDGKGPVFIEDNKWFPMQDPDMPDTICIGHGVLTGTDGSISHIDVKGVRSLDYHVVDRPVDGQIEISSAMCFGTKKQALNLAKAYQEQGSAERLPSMDDDFTKAVETINTDGIGLGQ